MGTGGGEGADENFAVWEERDPTVFVKYTPQHSNLYTTLIYIWDKAKGFLLTKPKGPLPPNAAIRDGVPANASTASKKGASKKGQYKGTPHDEHLMGTLNEIVRGRKETSDLLSEFLQGTKEPKSIIIGRMIETMGKTKALVDAKQEECFKLYEEKEAIKRGSGTAAEKKDKALPVKRKLNAADDELGSLKRAFDIQRAELDEFTGRDKTQSEGPGGEDGFSSGYESS